MKKLVIALFIILPSCLFAQIGLKAGLNFANVTKVSSIDNSSRSGFHVGILLSPKTKIIGSRTELIYSRQGYDYKTSSNTGSVNLDYIMLPQFMTINITKYFQIQLGAQMAYLLNAKADTMASTGNATADNIMKYYNRFNYGFGGGIEIHPVAGLLIGARVNISLNNTYTDLATTPPSGTGTPSFVPKVDVKNNLFQISAGWIFGNQSPKKKKDKKE